MHPPPSMGSHLGNLCMAFLARLMSVVHKPQEQQASI